MDNLNGNLIGHNDFVLIDPLDEPLYSYEIPFLTKFYNSNKQMNKWLSMISKEMT